MAKRTKKDLVRLACRTCDREDCDPTTVPEALAAGWTEVEAVNPPDAYWWDYLGDCPDCKEVSAYLEHEHYDCE